MSPSDKPSRAVHVVGWVHRWIRRLATIVLLAVSLALAAAVLLWSVGAEFLAARATAVLNSRVLGTDTHLHVGEVKGSPFRRLILADVRLERASRADTVAFLTARELELTYDLWGLLHGRYALSRVSARGLRVNFRMEEGELLLPTFRGGGGGKDKNPAPPFRVRTLHILDGGATVELPWRTVALDSLVAELSIDSDRNGLAFDVGRLHGVFQDSLGSLDLLDGTVHVGETIRLDSMQGTWDGAGVAASGVVAKGPVDLEIHAAELPLERLGRFLENDDLDPGYVVRADGRLAADAGRMTFEVDGEARWDVWAADHLAGTGSIERGVLRLREVRATIDGASLSQVELDIPLHEPSFTARGRAQHLDTATLHIPFFDLVPGTLDGTAQLRFLDRKDMGRDMDLRVRAEGGELLQIPLSSAIVVARARDGVFTFDSLRVDLEGAKAAAVGKTSAEFLDLDIVYEGRIEPLRRWIRRNEAEGAASLRATLNGPPRSPILIGEGEIRNVVIASVRAPLVRIEEAHGPLYEGQDLEIHAKTPEGVTVGAVAFDRGETRFTVAPDSVLVESLTLERGDSTVSARGSFRWEPEIVADVLEATARADGRRFTAAAPFRLHLGEDEVSTPGLAVDTPRGSFTLEGSWNTSTRAFSLDALVRGVDPSVFFPPESPPPVAIGKLSGSIALHGVGDLVNGMVDLGVREIDWTRGHLDTAYVSGTVAGGVVRLERLAAGHAGGWVTAQGDIEFPEPLIPVVRGLRKGRYPEPGSTRYHLEVVARDLELGEWKFLLPPGQRFQGRVDVAGTLEGTSSSPILEWSGGVRGLSWKGFEADSVMADARYAGENLNVTRAAVAEEGQVVEVSGDFPVSFTMLPFSFEIPERELHLVLEARNGSLRGLELTPWIRKAEGSFRSRLELHGTPRRPLADGWARVEGGRVELRERDEVVEDIRAVFAFRGDVVEVQQADGLLTVGWARAGTRGGRVTATGSYRLAAQEAESYRLVVSLEDGLVGEEGVYAARVSGSVTLEPLPASDGRLYPTAIGDLFVHRLEYAGSLKPQDVSASGPPTFLYEVTLNAPEKILVRTDQAHAELGGELRARRALDRQVVLGTLEILSGSYQFFQKTFRVTDGRLIWEKAESRIPTLDIRAETKEAGYLIVVDLQGPADQPEIQFSAESLDQASGRELTQDEIIQLLALGAVGLAPSATAEGAQETGTGGVAGQAAAGWGILGAEQLLGSEIERQLLKQIGFSAELQVETESQAGQFEPKVGLRTYVTPELSLQYLQGLSRTYEQDVAVEYRLRRLIVLRGSVINLPLESKQEYNLDLKFRQEY